MNTIHFYNVVDSEVHGCYIYNGRRPTDAGVYGEGISLEESARVDIHDNIFDTRTTTYRGYDMIKVRQNSHHCTVRGNIIKFLGNSGYSLGIQLSSGAYCNTVMGNTIHSNDAGVKIHSGHENVVIGNTIVARCLANGALELIGNSSRNIFAHNFATSDAQDMAFVGFRMEGAGEEQWDNMVIGNLFKLPNVANSVGILMDYQTSGGARRTIIRGNKILGGTASDTGISLSSLSQDCVIEDNDLRDPNLNTKIVVAGSGHIIRRNLGYPTENQGRASVAQGQTSVTIAHGLVSTPSVVKALPEWLTTVRLSSKDATNIVLEFGTAAPTGGSYVNWDAAV
jgi:parallel beta-helix repeat protein